ncbi:hypothetical protein DL771_005068 [Monosporascus sp. 5C6A]|nr:hypothetical protein DL771_005068 [Monosporascus sp. 5C6A]
MASIHNLKALDAAIENTPIIDNHAHPLLKPAYLSKFPLLSITTEAHGDAIEDSRLSLAHIRATKQLAQILGCEETWEAVVSSIERKRIEAPDVWTERCMEGIETILIDDGLDGAEKVESYSWHDAFTKSKCKRIVRIEALAEDIIRRHCGLSEFGGLLSKQILHDFEREIQRSIADPDVVGFKSIICYRGGLDFSQVEEMELSELAKDINAIANLHRSGEQLFERLQHSRLNGFFVCVAAKLIRDKSTFYKKPIQFHTGLGDNDITLTKSSPSHLQKFIRKYPTVPIVILHAGYPWTREAAYLAMAYPNVYVDTGEVFPCLSRQGQEGVVKQILELCPWSKVLWSTDGHWFPEMYAIATIQVRSVLKTVLSELVKTGQLDEKQAVQLVQDILFNNSKKLYNLEVESSLPSFAELTQMGQQAVAAAGNTYPPESILGKLRCLDAKWLRIYWHDYTSSARCRLIPMKEVYKTLESGKPIALPITKASLGLLQTDAMIPEITATGGYILHPVWDTLKAGPTSGHVSCHGEFTELDGAEEILCPRTLLRKTLEKAASHGLDFLLGFEIEFLVLERNPDSAAGPTDRYRPLRSSDGHAWSAARAVADWGAAGPGAFGTAVDEILGGLDAAGIEVEQFHPESAPGQFELVLGPLPALEACDALLHARQILEAAAARHGFRVTLHPKPFEAACGSASHVHMSLSSADGQYDTNKPEVYEAFYAGILRHFRAIVAFTYASPASYERMVDGLWAGGRWVTWGTQNKETPLRKCEGAHWELKVLDGLANPYFAMAAILAAGTDGVVTKAPLTWGDCAIDPAKLTEEQKRELGVSEMFPGNLVEALVALQADKELCQLLHPRFVERYIDVKKAEIALLEPMKPDQRRRWIMERKPAGIASTPGHSAPKKMDTDRWPALIANPDEAGIYPMPGFDVSRPYPGEPMDSRTVTLTVKRNTPGEGVVETRGSDDYFAGGMLRLNPHAELVQAQLDEDGEFEAQGSWKVCTSRSRSVGERTATGSAAARVGRAAASWARTALRRIEEAPAVGRGCGAPRLDRLPDECSFNFTAATNPTAYGYSWWDDETRDVDWLRGSAIWNMASGPAPADSDRIREITLIVKRQC